MGSIFSTDGLKGRHALVTGGTAGIGLAIARCLTSAGSKVTITGRNSHTGQISKEFGANFIAFDVADPNGIKPYLDDLADVDILVNNAGIDQHGYFTNSDIDEWRRLIDVNLMGVFSVTKEILPAMQNRGFGRVINIASEAARRGSKGGSVYAAAKGGVISFTKSIAQESARYGVTSNVILPGPVDTPLLQKAVENGGDKMLKVMKAATLLGRLGTPEEVAGLVVFLASNEAAFITGEVIGVSGGMGV